MPRPLSARLRRFWLNVHLWLGVGLLLALVPISVTGAILVWHDPLDRALHAERYAISGRAQLPLGTYAQAAAGAFAGRATLTQIRLPQDPGDPVVAVGRLAGPAAPGARTRTLNAWIDPPTGRVLSVADPLQTPSMVMHRLHGSLLIPGLGRKIVGWLGWAMFVSCLTGLWLWWPRNGQLAMALRWRRGGSQLFNLHHMVGFWIALPLAALALTGVAISFPQSTQALFGQSAPRPPSRTQPPPLATPALGEGQAVEAARRLAGGAEVRSVSWPQSGARPSWRVELSRPMRIVQVEDATGAATLQPPAPARSPLMAWMRGVHDGSRLGAIWRTIITLAGAAPALLALTGVIMWLRRRAVRAPA